MLRSRNSHELDELKRELIANIREFICSQLDCSKNGSEVAAQFIKILGAETNSIKDPTKILKALTAKAIELRNIAAGIKNEKKYADIEYQTVRIVRETLEYYENVDKTDIMKRGYKPVPRPTKESITQASEYVKTAIAQMAPAGYGKRG